MVTDGAVTECTVNCDTEGTGGVNEGTDTVTVADGTATVDAATTGTTIDPGKFTDGTTTGIPRAAIDNMCAAADYRNACEKEKRRVKFCEMVVSVVESLPSKLFVLIGGY